MEEGSFAESSKAIRDCHQKGWFLNVSENNNKLLPAVVAEWSKALSQIQVERMPKVLGLNPRLGLRH